MENIKKSALGAANTESGKGKSSISNIAESPGNVKTPRATAWEFAALLRRLIFAMRKHGISDSAIVAVLFDTLKPGREGDPKC